MSIIACYHLKGGVGKTAAAVNLSYLAAQENIKTLLIDFDPQGSASYYFRVRSSQKLKSKKLLKGGKKIDKNIKATDYENLDILPSNLSYRKLDLKLNSLKKSRLKLKEILRPFDEEYQIIFIDCPPNITLVSENIFYAAHFLLMPIIPTTLSILTFEKLYQFFNDKNINSSKIIVFFSMVEKRKKMHQNTMKIVSVDYQVRLLKSYIPFAVDVENMGIHREPIFCFKPNSVASQSYKALWCELNKLW